MGRARDARARPDPRAPRERAAVRRRPHRRMPARHHGDRQPRARAARWRGRGRAVRVESALDTGRCRRRARRPRRHLGLRAEGRGPRHLLPAHQRGARDQTAHHDGRRRRCREGPPHKAPRPPPRREGGQRGDDARWDPSPPGDGFLTATGNLNVIGRAHFACLKDGAILANVGHFNDEIELGALAEMAKGRRVIRPFVEEFQLADKKKVFVLAEGRLLNHAAAEANPAAVMDMSFANQALSIEYLLKHGKELAPRVYPVPRELDEEIARRKLEAMGMNIDTMSAAQAEYARSWKAGT